MAFLSRTDSVPQSRTLRRPSTLSLLALLAALLVTRQAEPAFARKGRPANAARRIQTLGKSWGYRGPAGRIFPLPVDIRLELNGRTSGRVARVSIFATVSNAGKSCRIRLKASLVQGRYFAAKAGPGLLGRVKLDKLDTTCRSKAITNLVAKLRAALKRSPPKVKLVLRGRALCPADGPQTICLTSPPPKPSGPTK